MTERHEFLAPAEGELVLRDGGIYRRRDWACVRAWYRGERFSPMPWVARGLSYFHDGSRDKGGVDAADLVCEDSFIKLKDGWRSLGSDEEIGAGDKKHVLCVTPHRASDGFEVVVCSEVGLDVEPGDVGRRVGLFCSQTGVVAISRKEEE